MYRVRHAKQIRFWVDGGLCIRIRRVRRFERRGYERGHEQLELDVELVVHGNGWNRGYGRIGKQRRGCGNGRHERRWRRRNGGNGGRRRRRCDRRVMRAIGGRSDVRKGTRVLLSVRDSGLRLQMHDAV